MVASKKKADSPPAAPTQPARAGRAKGTAASGSVATEAPIVPAREQTSLLPVPIADILRDPRLQGRDAGINQDTVDEYAVAIKDGATFPPVELVRIEDHPGVPDGLYLVDGWHRVAAAEKAGKATVIGHILPGTWREAIITAAKSNGTHGLRRTHADKRRAVRLVLADPDLCGLSGRLLGRVIDVSHTYVDEVRKHYGIGVGELLTEEIRRRMDGEAPAEWVALHAGQERWVVSWIEQVRKCATVDELARLFSGTMASTSQSEVGRTAVALRLTEFGTQPWPWTEDLEASEEEREEHRRNVVRTIDTPEDARRALCSKGCPDGETLLRLLADSVVLRSDYAHLEFDRIEQEHGERPGVLAALKEARTARDAVVASDPSLAAAMVHRLKDQPAAQHAALTAAIDRGLAVGVLNWRSLCPEVRDGPYRDLLEASGADLGECPDPCCGGWTLASYGGAEVRCVRCERGPKHVTDVIRHALQVTGRLLTLPDYAVVVANTGFCEPNDVVVVDATSVDLLAFLATELAGKAAWLAKLPASVRDNLKAWHARPRPRFDGTPTPPQEGPVTVLTDLDGGGESVEVDDPPGNAANLAADDAQAEVSDA